MSTTWNAKFRRNVNKPVNINGYSNVTDIANEFVVHFNKVFRHDDDDDKMAYNDFSISHKRVQNVLKITCNLAMNVWTRLVLNVGY